MNFLTHMLNEINHEYELGVWSDINHVIELNSEFLDEHKLSFSSEENAFYLVVRLKAEKESLYKDFCGILINGIQYDAMTFYSLERKSDKKIYMILSANNKKKGFLLYLVFEKNNFSK